MKYKSKKIILNHPKKSNFRIYDYYEKTQYINKLKIFFLSINSLEDIEVMKNKYEEIAKTKPKYKELVEMLQLILEPDNTKYAAWLKWYFLERIQYSKHIEKIVENHLKSLDYEVETNKEWDIYYACDMIAKKDDLVFIIQIKAFPDQTTDRYESYYNNKIISKFKNLEKKLNINNALYLKFHSNWDNTFTIIELN